MDNLFIATYQNKTYLVRNSECREEAYDKVHDFLGGDIHSLETAVYSVKFLPESDVAEVTQ